MPNFVCLYVDFFYKFKCIYKPTASNTNKGICLEAMDQMDDINTVIQDRLSFILCWTARITIVIKIVLHNMS